MSFTLNILEYIYYFLITLINRGNDTMLIVADMGRYIPKLQYSVIRYVIDSKLNPITDGSHNFIVELFPLYTILATLGAVNDIIPITPHTDIMDDTIKDTPVNTALLSSERTHKRMNPSII